MSETWIILGRWRTSHKYLPVQAFGTASCRPFLSETSAETTKKKLEKQLKHLEFLVLPVMSGPS